MQYLPVPVEGKQHPKYEYTTILGENIIVIFKGGYIVRPTPAAEEAFKRIRKAIHDLGHDLQLIREFHGNLVLYSMNGQIYNPEINEDMKAEFMQAANEMYPQWRIVKSWENTSAGIDGFSVMMAKAP